MKEMQIKTTLGYDLTAVRMVTKLGGRQHIVANMGRWVGKKHIHTYMY